MSWELVAGLVIAVWILGLGLLVALMRAASRGDAMIDADARRARERESAARRQQAEEAARAKERPARERWTIPSKDEPAPRHMPDDEQVERRRSPR